MSAHSNYRHICRKLGVVLVGVIAAALPLAARASTIGLYSDESGSSCSFSGSNPGLFTAYVVVKPDDRGLHGVRFAAPVPACLGATFVEAIRPLGGETIGEPTTGISVAWGTCQTETALALTINYYRNSSTEPCCAFPIVEDSYVHMIEGVDCSHVSYEVEPVVSHFNADASCACNDVAPPSPPRVAIPANGSTTTIVSTKLEWTTWSRDTDITSFDLYFGLDPDPAFKTTLSAHSYQPSTLQPLTQYYWRVVAHDSEGLATSSPTWTFTTRPLNSAPVVAPVAPFSGATDVARAALLQWSPYDIDGDALHFDIYLGTESDPPLLVSGRTDSTFTTSPLAFSTTYYWKVMAQDTHGHTSAGPVWSFTTRPENFAPFAASLPAPGGNATMQPLSLTLRWAAGDPDPADALSFDVYFGTSLTPPLVESDVSSQSLVRSGLKYDTRYYWRVVTRDNHGAEKAGPVWYFTTRPENLPPSLPSSPVPANNVGGMPMAGSLKWTCSDPEGQAVSYDVYLGLSMAPPLVGHTVNPSFDYSLPYLGRYYWKIVAKDASGKETAGPIWMFVTSLHPGVNAPPLSPSKPSPAKAATNQPLDLRLTWTCSDPNHDALSYDVYLGTALVAANVKTQYYEPATLAPGTTYSWQIVARDTHGAETPGPLWSFGTLAVSNLSAVATEEGVQVVWRLAGTDGMESYTLLRTERGGTQTAVLTQGAVAQVSGSFLDTSAEQASTYQYSLSVHVASGEDIRSSAATARAYIPGFVLSPNQPNPFNPQTTIPYSVSWGTRVKLTIYDASGRLVKVLVDERQSVGKRSVVWNGEDATGRSVASGVYFCVLQANNERRTQKMVLLK